MKLGITQRQKIVLDFIKEYITINGYSPTIQNICDGVGIKSKAEEEMMLDLYLHALGEI